MNAHNGGQQARLAQEEIVNFQPQWFKDALAKKPTADTFFAIPICIFSIGEVRMPPRRLLFLCMVTVPTPTGSISLHLCSPTAPRHCP